MRSQAVNQIIPKKKRIVVERGKKDIPLTDIALVDDWYVAKVVNKNEIVGKNDHVSLIGEDGYDRLR